jgi:lipoyl(octanoyl) transferase
MSQPCEVRRLARVTYENGMHIQQTLVGLRQQERIADQLLLLEHPPVITLGRGGNRANLLATEGMLRENGVRFYETTRGGDITYHGPGQLVGYPILHMGEGSRDVRKYVTKVEEVLIRTVADYGIAARRREGSRGVWVGEEKIAAIGVRIARWVTSHGFALNVRTNLDHFRFITPCGIRGAGVTSMEKITGRPVDPGEVADRLLVNFSTVFERDLRRNDDVMRVVTVLPHDGDRLLLLHRNAWSGDFWQPVTGGINPGEAPDAAAARELTEETGFSSHVVPLGLRQAFLIDPKYVGSAADQLVFAEQDSFAAEVDSRQPVTLEAEEHDRWRWFSFEEALENIRWSDDRETIEKLQRMLRLVTA